MIKIKKVKEDKIIFTNGWRIFDDYSQEWAENNYADYKACIKGSILEIGRASCRERV